ncbi:MULTISPECIES: membrane protein insertase YidC [unclassified Streptomyces]|uniref:membrane protein insertase YidC n=1 Tax=Streptomyces TaxID=1883 RepID=UPI00036E6D60|nr:MULTISPECIES: membrane protein insertase YidC [unclassified Streptomyces]MYS33956.1 membrane protein insertase YidC [Streptomyces sp. SID4920]MYX70265.1 membrane protein insertase YidC [Streptomyces sp. SID8373]WSX92051.1 membrane protein insertase YidC [Streptomyces sp. NBC_00891]WSY06528.1 membrane protein insertase YidC [Streptomyces sp. NBC_00890]WSZ08152.1 membrane protein insertase YidC [Streptomyces sp. NBC_00869]WSZ24348.1 membrane protein insertase YidC [Streptomyces sp. NBC_00870
MDTIASLFSFITWPVSWVIVQFHKLYGAIFGPDTGWAWGLSIVSLVVLIRICLIPLFVKQIKSTRNMQLLQPKMKAIQERYKSDKQRQSEEMMKLYKETGTNPLSSCLPILAQSPFFFALYHVLSAIASNKKIGVIDQSLLDSARQAHIFGAPLAAKFMDSAEKVDALGASLTDVRVVTAIMIVMMSASQFFTQRQLMTKNVDLTVKTPYMQQQKMLMYIFPLIFAVMGINFPVGVLVYWLTTNVWTMGQQMYVINQNPTPGSKAQEQYLGRLLKSVTAHGEVRGRTRRNTVKRIVAKGPDRNDIERKFVVGLAKLGLAPQEDGTVAKSDTAVAEAEGGAAQRRQQPKRQTKSQRQTGATHQGGAKDGDSDESESKTSLQKSTARDDKSKPAGKSASGSSRQAKSGQRKGPQRPKHPSKK